MAEVTGAAWLWNDPDDEVEAEVTETTPGGEEPTRWVAVRANLNPGEAIVIKGRLESEDIPAVVQQEAFGSFIGLTVGPLGSAKVLVPAPLAERALAILAQTFDAIGDEEENWDEALDDDFNKAE